MIGLLQSAIQVAKAQLVRSNHALARKYLRGTGLEFGSLVNPVRLSRNAKAYYIEFYTREKLRMHHDIDLNSLSAAKIDVFADAHCPPFKKQSLDFIIASHLIEHLSNPLFAVEQWHSILAQGGILLLTVPIKYFTFDKHRPNTTLQHLISDYEGKRNNKDITSAHFDEWVELVDNIKKGTTEFFNRVEHLKHIQYSIHMHVWDIDDIKSIFKFMSEKKICFTQLKIVDRTVKKNGMDATFIFKKCAM